MFEISGQYHKHKHNATTSKYDVELQLNDQGICKHGVQQRVKKGFRGRRWEPTGEQCEKCEEEFRWRCEREDLDVEQKKLDMEIKREQLRQLKQGNSAAPEVTKVSTPPFIEVSVPTTVTSASSVVSALETTVVDETTTAAPTTAAVASPPLANPQPQAAAMPSSNAPTNTSSSNPIASLPNNPLKPAQEIKTITYPVNNAWDLKEYVGHVNAKGQPNGQGKMTWQEGTTYNGMWENDQRNGRGVTCYADGRRYEGEWKKGRKHGMGLHTWPDGATYNGMWENGLRSGQGVQCYADGNCYEGEWKNGKRHGRGKLTAPDGSIIYNGKWKDGIERPLLGRTILKRNKGPS